MKLGSKDYLRIGDYHAICDRCGFKFFASELRREWQGYMVCATCFEPRHPQDTIRVPRDDQSVSWSRPEPTDVEIVVGPADPTKL